MTSHKPLRLEPGEAYPALDWLGEVAGIIAEHGAEGDPVTYAASTCFAEVVRLRAQLDVAGARAGQALLQLAHADRELEESRRELARLREGAS
jgi:hypothetical protein